MPEEEKKKEVRIVVPKGQVVLRAIDKGVVAIVPEGYEGYLIERGETLLGTPTFNVVPFEKGETVVTTPEGTTKMTTTEPEAVRGFGLLTEKEVKAMEEVGKEVGKVIKPALEAMARYAKAGWEKIREILRKKSRGERLTPEEEAKLEEAFEEIGIPVIK